MKIFLCIIQKPTEAWIVDVLSELRTPEVNCDFLKLNSKVLTRGQEKQFYYNFIVFLIRMKII